MAGERYSATAQITRVNNLSKQYIDSKIIPIFALTIKTNKIMVTIKFAVDIFDKTGVTILPTVFVDCSNLKAENKITLAIIWLFVAFCIQISWTSKKLADKE